MNLKSIALGGAAIVGLVATTLPAAAYTHHPSTPAEQKQTDDLNAQALQKAQGVQQTASNDQSMPSQAQPSAMSSDQTAQPQSSDQSATNATMEGAPSNDKMAMNATQGSQTEAAEGQSQTVAPSAVSSGGSAVSLAQVANPPQTLVNASVETANGQAIGAVQKVVTDGSGKAQTLNVALLGAQSKIVSIDADQLSYDQSRNVVVAQLSADQIQALPATPQG